MAPFNKQLIALSTCAVALASLANAAPAAARANPVVITGSRPDPDELVKRVSYRDLQLMNASDQLTLIHRVDVAVRSVCPVNFGSVNTSLGDRACRTASWKLAQPQIDMAVLRAKEIAMNGSSLIAPTAIAIVAAGNRGNR